MAKLLLGSVVGPQGPQGTPGVNGSQGPQGIPGPNEIAATTDVVGLTTGQLLYNNGGKVGSVEIVDKLTSTATDKPLSANQGKVLKGLIDDNGSAIGQNASDLNTHKADNMSPHPIYAKKIQENLVTATLQNGWTGTIKYRKNDLGQVELQITVTASATVTSKTIIATLPAGYKGFASEIPAYDNNTFGFSFIIDSNGSIIIASNNFVQGVTYYASMIYYGN